MPAREEPFLSDQDLPERGLTPAEVQQELAEERTAMALQRTVLANERTLNSWLRTGLAIVAAGFTIGILLGREGPMGPARAFGVALIAVGGLACVVGLVRYRALRVKLAPEQVSSVPMWLLELLVGLLLVVSLVGALLLLRWF
jgi:putative membrane protein